MWFGVVGGCVCGAVGVWCDGVVVWWVVVVGVMWCGVVGGCVCVLRCVCGVVVWVVVVGVMWCGVEGVCVWCSGGVVGWGWCGGRVGVCVVWCQGGVAGVFVVECGGVWGVGMVWVWW